MSRRNSFHHYVDIDNRPYDEILKHFEESAITLPLHRQFLILKIDDSHIDKVNLIKNSFVLHVGLSLIEYILLQCNCTAIWLKDHFFPTHNILFKNGIILNNNEQQEILNVLHKVENWPVIVFKDNKEIRDMLHIKKSSTNTVYGLYVAEENNKHVFINLQLLDQAAKANRQMQSFYSVMFAVKYLHEFAHFIYSIYGRAHLLNTYNIPLTDSVHTPNGVLRGESGNKFEEQMLGFILSHAGHANISMNIKMCLGHSSLTDHLRIIGPEFINKLLRKETYQDGQMNPDFLHYTDDEFCMLDRFSMDKVADVRVFYSNDDDPVHTDIDLRFSLSDDDDNEDTEPLEAFVPQSDKIIL